MLLYEKTFSMGLDVGSTTVKLVVLDKNKIQYSKYQRHFSDIRKQFLIWLMKPAHSLNRMILRSLTGSGGISAAMA